MNDIEVWKPHPEFQFVEVSTLGNVRTFDREVTTNSGVRLVNGRVLKPFYNKDGYLLTKITVDGKRITKGIHRLVAETFIPNPENLSQVNHKDCNRDNNNTSNLEWVTSEYNIKYRESHGKALNHPVFAINLSTLKISRFSSQSEAGRILGVHKQAVNMVVKGRYKKAGGYWFTNADDNAIESIRIKFGDEVDEILSCGLVDVTNNVQKIRKH